MPSDKPAVISDKVYDAIKEVLDSESLPYYFNINLYNRNFQPDINGYVLVGIVPPHLSGFDQKHQDRIDQIANEFFFLGLETTSPDHTVKGADVSSGSGSLPYATGKSSGDSFTVNFIENKELDIFYMHHTWSEYIKEVLYGEVSPDEKYYSGEVPIIDYLGSIYIAKFTPDMQNITYIGKAVGVFPNSVPTSDMIGQRSTNELTMLNITYTISKYEDVVIKDGEPLSPVNQWVYAEFQEMIKNKISVVGGIEQHQRS